MTTLPDDAIIRWTTGSIRPVWARCTWREFREANADGIDDRECAAIESGLITHKQYSLGGGAAGHTMLLLGDLRLAIRVTDRPEAQP